MKRTVLALLFCLLMSLGLTACGSETTPASSPADSPQTTAPASSGSGNQAVAPSTPADLKLVESGYTVTDSGYILYAVCIENPNADKAAEFPVISVVGKDAGGAILFSDDWTLGEVLPGEKAFYATSAGNGVAPASVEISLNVDSKKWKSESAYPAGIYSFENVNLIEGGFDQSITGQITLTQDNDKFKEPMIVVVFRDANGKLIGGESTYLSNELTAGKAAAFDISLWDAPDFASYEVYANAWM